MTLGEYGTPLSLSFLLPHNLDTILELININKSEVQGGRWPLPPMTGILRAYASPYPISPRFNGFNI